MENKANNLMLEIVSGKPFFVRGIRFTLESVALAYCHTVGPNERLVFAGALLLPKSLQFSLGENIATLELTGGTVQSVPWEG